MPQGVRWVGRRASGDDAVEPILRVKVVAHVRDELVVGRMIQRLDADNLGGERVGCGAFTLVTSKPSGST